MCMCICAHNTKSRCYVLLTARKTPLGILCVESLKYFVHWIILLLLNYIDFFKCSDEVHALSL